MAFFPGASPGCHDFRRSPRLALGHQSSANCPGAQSDEPRRARAAARLVRSCKFGLDLNLSTSPNRRCKPRSTPASLSCPQILPNPADLQQSQPCQTRADYRLSALTSKTLPLSTLRISRIPAWRRKFPNFPALVVWSASAAVEAAAAYSGQPHRAVHPMVSRWKLCARQHRPGRRQSSQRQFRGGSSSLHHRRQRSVACRAGSYGSTIVAYRNGAPVRLSDVATVIDDAENRQARCLDQSDAGDPSSTFSASPAPTSSPLV